MTTSAPPPPPLNPGEHRPRLAFGGVTLTTLGLYFGGWGFVAFAIGLVLLGWAWTVPGEGFRLSGPHLRWELARPTPYRHLLRVLVALGFGLAVWQGVNNAAYFVNMTPAAQRDMSVRGGGPPGTQVHWWLGHTAESVAAGLALSLVGVAGVLVPMGFAGERANRRLELLLATPLTARELLASRALARLALVAEPILLTLPFWAVLSLFHGVELGPAARLALPVICTAFAVAMVGASVAWQTKDPLGGVLLTVVVVVFVQIATAVPMMACTLSAESWKGWTRTPVPAGLVAALLPVCEFVGMPNPLVQAGSATVRIGWLGTPQADAYADAARHYCAGCVGAGLLAFVYACRDLRRLERGGFMAALAVPPPKPGRAASRGARKRAIIARKAARNLKRQKPAPRVPAFDLPVLWWSAHALGPLPASGRAAGRGWLLLMLKAFAAGVVVYGIDAAWSGLARAAVLPDWGTKPLAVLGARALPLLVAVPAFALLAIVGLVLGAATMPAERAADTFESLVLTGLPAGEILRQKLLGVGLALAVPAAPVAAVGAGLTFAGHLSILTFSGWLLALPGFGAFFVLLGAACGARARSVGRAVLLALAAAGAAAWLAVTVGDSLRWPWMTDADRRDVNTATGVALALTPPGPLWGAAWPSLPEPLARVRRRNAPELVGPTAALAYFAGLASTGAACYGLWRLAVYRLRRDLELLRGPAAISTPTPTGGDS